MVALWNRADHYIFILFLSSFFFFFISSPNLSSRRLDVYHTLAHGVALMRIQNASLKCAARGSLQIHHRPTLSGHIFTTGQNLLSSNTSSTCPHNMVNFSPLTAEIGSGVWGTPTNFNGFCVLAALLHGTLVVGVSQTVRR